jgi:hypothetical protein
MAIQLIETYPGRYGSARFARLAAAAVGLVLVLAGVLAAVGLLLIAAMLVITEGRADAPTYVWAVILALATIVTLWFGIRAMRGTRRMALFLRRFGYRDATALLSYTVATTPGRSWRMVALDDANIAPVGVAKPSRRPYALAILLVLAIVGYGLYATFFTDLLTPRAAQRGAVASVDTFLDNVVNNLIAVVAAIVIAVVILVLAAIAMVIGVAGGLVGRATRVARERAQVQIGRGEEVYRAADTIRHNNRRVFGSRLMVCRVANPLWQDAVEQLMSVVDAVVIDVSHATDNVVWEVETMRAAADHRWVVVCGRDRVELLLRAANTSVPPGVTPEPAVRLAQLLDGHEVLVYGTTAPDQRSFARALRNRLDSITLTTPPRTAH